MPSAPLPRSVGQESVTTLLGNTAAAPYWGNNLNAYANYAGNIGNLWNSILFGGGGGGGGGGAGAPARPGPINMGAHATGGPSGVAGAILGANWQPSPEFWAANFGGSVPLGTNAPGGGFAGNAGGAGILGALLGAYGASSGGSFQQDLGNLQQYGGAAGQSVNNIVPGQGDLQSLLTQQVTQDLQAGDQLTPMQQLRLQQNVRGSQAARGMGYGPDDAAQESIALWLGGEELKRARQDNARTQMASNYALTTDPVMSMFGQNRAFAGQTQNALMQALGMIPSADPLNAYASDLYNTNYNAAWADLWHSQDVRAAKSAANKALVGTIVGSVLGAGGNIGAAGMMGCWVAREVYGQDSPKWLEFREWMQTRAPRWLTDLYNEAGPQVAEYIKDKPELKALAKKFMDAKRKELHAI